MIKVFITGATGFIGKTVTCEILKRLKPEDRLIMLVRKPVEFADSRVVVVSGDLESLDRVDSVVRDADYIIHIGGEARLFGGNDYSRTNVVATQKLVNLALEGNCLKRFIFVSSIAAMDRAPSDLCKSPVTVGTPCHPRTEYGKSKLMAEIAIAQSNLPYTIFRPAIVYGRGMRDDSHLRRFARFIERGVPLHRFGFPGKISLIHVDDLASAIARCLTSESGRNRTYLAVTEVMPLGEALSLLGEALSGQRLLQVRIPACKSVFQRLHSRLPVFVAGIFLDYFRMNDPAFRNDFIKGRQPKLLRDNVHDIIEALRN